MADPLAAGGRGRSSPDAPEITISESGHRLTVGARPHDLPPALTKAAIRKVAQALAFYGCEANHYSRDDKMPALWRDNGEKARSALLSIGAIDDLAELEVD